MERARVVARIAPSASKRIAPVFHFRVFVRICTGYSAFTHYVCRLPDDCWMPHALALAAVLVLAPPWVWPVDPPPVLVHPFRAPEWTFGPGHRGVDLAAASGTVYAPADGVVHFAGVVVDRPVLSIEQSDGVITSFEPVTTELVAGDVVERGQVVGTVLAGHCASVCLHFGVRVDGEYVSPLAWLGGLERAVLLPTRTGGERRMRERPPTAEGHGSG